jgi:hypothetical protein
MTGTERRYSENEVAEIFRRASETQEGTRAPLASRDGMTVGALQEIGREVGLSADAIASAARSIDRSGVEGTRRFLGLPLGVSRTIPLDRRLSDSEWESLVVDLRQTFDARGRLKQEGGFRQWTNGNLQALLEPMGDAQQLRLRTTHGAARAWMTAGVAVLAFAAVIGVAALAGASPADGAFHRVSSALLVGGVMFLAGAVRLPGWAKERQRQMREIAERLQR